MLLAILYNSLFVSVAPHYNSKSSYIYRVCRFVWISCKSPLRVSISHFVMHKCKCVRCVLVQIKNNVSQHLALLKALFFITRSVVSRLTQFKNICSLWGSKWSAQKHIQISTDTHYEKGEKKSRKNDVYFVARAEERTRWNTKKRDDGNDDDDDDGDDDGAEAMPSDNSHKYKHIHISHSINKFCLCNKLARWWRGKSECDNTHMHKPRNTYSSS